LNGERTRFKQEGWPSGPPLATGLHVPVPNNERFGYQGITNQKSQNLGPQAVQTENRTRA